MPSVAALRVAPVKGLALLEREAVVLDPAGVAENRRFFLLGDHGRHVSGLAHGPLVRVVPAWDADAERLTLTFPDGEVVTGSSVAGEEEVEIPYLDRTLRGRVVEGPFATALSAYAGRPLRLVRTTRTAEASEAPVSLVSSASVEALERASDHPGRLDERRFRMLVTLAGCAPYEEDTWVGREVRLGAAVVRVERPVPRCATTTRDPVTGLRDFDALAAIRDHRGLSERRTLDFGVYATVVRPGRVAVGDEVSLD